MILFCRFFVVAFLLIIGSGCATVYPDGSVRVHGATVGALGGAAVGAAVDHRNRGRGAAVGAALGALLGSEVERSGERRNYDDHGRYRDRHYPRDYDRRGYRGRRGRYYDSHYWDAYRAGREARQRKIDREERRREYRLKRRARERGFDDGYHGW